MGVQKLSPLPFSVTRVPRIMCERIDEKVVSRFEGSPFSAMQASKKRKMKQRQRKLPHFFVCFFSELDEDNWHGWREGGCCKKYAWNKKSFKDLEIGRDACFVSRGIFAHYLA